VKVAAIALTTFKEAVRQPVLYVLVVGSMVLVLVVGQLPMFTFSVLDDLKMVKDMAVSTSVLVGLLVGIFLAVQVLTEEIENWTVLTVLSKPVRRWEFVAGKFAGLVLVMGATYAVMSVAFIALTWVGIYGQLVESSNVYPEYLKAFWSDFAWPTANELWRGFVMSFLHSVLLTAVAVAACTRLPMVLSVVVYFAVFVAGHLTNGLVHLAEHGGLAMRVLAGVVAVVLPNLETFNVAHAIGLGQKIGTADMTWCLLYTVCYSGAAMVLAAVLFRRREVY
jgi:ABC-type transport system involved in multi-copper enzyme maturation permease subunit